MTATSISGVSGRNPGSTLCRPHRLRSISPAPIRGTIDSATSALPPEAAEAAHDNVGSAVHVGREVLGNDPKVREPNAIQPACIEAMQVVAAQKIDLFGAAGKGSLY